MLTLKSILFYESTESSFLSCKCKRQLQLHFLLFFSNLKIRIFQVIFFLFFFQINIEFADCEINKQNFVCPVTAATILESNTKSVFYISFTAIRIARRNSWNDLFSDTSFWAFEFSEYVLHFNVNLILYNAFLSLVCIYWFIFCIIYKNIIDYLSRIIYQSSCNFQKGFFLWSLFKNIHLASLIHICIFNVVTEAYLNVTIN